MLPPLLSEGAGLVLAPPPAAAAAGEVEEETALATESVEGEDGREAEAAARRREVRYESTPVGLSFQSQDIELNSREYSIFYRIGHTTYNQA